MVGVRASMWRWPCLAGVVVCLLASASAEAASTSPRIVGGTTVPITTYPFQVALYSPGAGSPYFGLTCGGSIYDATHVITAAHCVFDETTGRAVPISSLRVLAGTAHLRTSAEPAYPATVKDVAISAMSFDPAYDPSTSDYDAAVLTLAAPLYDPAAPPPALNGTTSIAPIPPITAGQANTFANPSLLSPVTVSGWGDRTPQPVTGQLPGNYPQDLQAVDINLVPDSTCQAAYGNITPRMICAGAPGKDSCFGDSGGPLVAQTASPAPPRPAADALVGIVSFGAGCGQPGFPGVYERVANPEIQAFVTSSPPQAPQPTAAPAISGTPSPGQTLSCSSGGWTGPPTSYTYQFARNGLPVTAASSVNTYTVQAGDAGTTIFCQVRAMNAGGYGLAQSAPVGVSVPAPPSTPAVVDLTPPKDTSSPVVSVASKSCRRGRCTINVRVVDPLPSSGLRRVQGTVSWKVRSTCRRRGRRVRCLKTLTRSTSVKSIGGGHFLITTGRLVRGTYTLSVLATDQAGNHARRPTTVTLRVR